jgi:hypothetical protein
MALLGSIIPQQQFEIIRERIGAILADELSNQSTLSGGTYANLAVYIERFIPFDKTEFPAINVALNRGDYDNKDVTATDGTYTFYIDVYASAKSSEDYGGDYAAMAGLQQLLGMCRAILENPVYRTLGFAPPSISRVTVRSIQVGDPNNHDATSSVMARVELGVRVAEAVELIDTIVFKENYTTVKLGLTDKGYLWAAVPRDVLFVDDNDFLSIDTDDNQLYIDNG